MDSRKLNLINEGIAKFDDYNLYSQIIGLVESVPPQERDYTLWMELGRAYSNRGVLGDDNYYQQEGRELNPELQENIEKSLEIFEIVKKEGEQDPLWWKRMGYSYLMYDGDDALYQALECAKRWQELSPQDQDARDLVEDCERYISQLQEKITPPKPQEETFEYLEPAAEGQKAVLEA